MNNTKIKEKWAGCLTQLRNPVFYGKTLWKIVRFCIFMGLSFLILYPFVVKLSSCFMSYEDLINPTVNLFPIDGSLTYLRQAMNKLDYWNTLLPTTILSVLVALAQVLISSITGYGMARFRFRGRNLLFVLVILTLLVPPQVLMIPLYVRFANFSIGFIEFNLLNTYWPFVLLNLTGQGLKSGLYIYLMRQYFQGLPVELEESAYIDGAGPYRTFVSIMWPNARN
ncbi:MAG: carbohydrate ABC transporter permease, partial [Oscillospiraceae bacterium]|nr:carbohydrate ABC transporter permease [Oscillospiraceae bacterium]